MRAHAGRGGGGAHDVGHVNGGHTAGETARDWIVQDGEALANHADELQGGGGVGC